MARKLRVQFPGAVYHVTFRGNGRASVFDEEDERTLWIGRDTSGAGNRPLLPSPLPTPRQEVLSSMIGEAFSSTIQRRQGTLIPFLIYYTNFY